MSQNQFSIGDLVASKHYPEQAEGYITKFYASGRVGVSSGMKGDRDRTFLPKNLVLVVEQIPPLQVEELPEAIATKSSVIEVRGCENDPCIDCPDNCDCNECDRDCDDDNWPWDAKDYPDNPDESYDERFDWSELQTPPISSASTPPPPPAQSEKLPVAIARKPEIARGHREEWKKAIATDEVMEVPPLEVEAMGEAHATECCDNDPCIDCDDYCDCSESEAQEEAIAQPINQAEEIEDFEDTQPWCGKSNNIIFRGLEYYSIEEYEELKNSNDPLNKEYYKTNYRGWKIEINHANDIFITRLDNKDQLHCRIYECWEEKLWIAKDRIDLVEFIEKLPGKLAEAIATDEVMEVPPLEVKELSDTIEHSPTCPECNSYDVSKDDLFSYHWCGNCYHVWEQENFSEAEELSKARAIDTQPLTLKEPESDYEDHEQQLWESQLVDWEYLKSFANCGKDPCIDCDDGEKNCDCDDDEEDWDWEEDWDSLVCDQLNIDINVARAPPPLPAMA